MEPSEQEFVTIGEILTPHGIKGKLRVKVLTDFPQRFAPSATIYINRQPMTISSTVKRKDNLIVKLDTIDTIADAERLKGLSIEIEKSQSYPLPEGQFYHFQLIGLEVWTTHGELLGTISEVLASSSNDIYVIVKAGKEILIPAIEDVVKSIDLDNGRVIIKSIDGLLNLNQKTTD